jgi:hypothetical protein
VFTYTGGEPVVYTVTVTQPASGGTISASPASGPAGTTITLTNSPAANYDFSHYTVDGTRHDANTFTLDSSATVSGVFTAKPAAGANVPIASLGGGSPAVLTVPAGGGAAALDVGVASALYTDPAPPSAFALPPDAIEALANASSVAVSFASSAPANVSLAYVHYVREAIKAAKSGIVITAVSAPEDTFTPVFKESEWWTSNFSFETVKDLYSAYSSAPVYSGNFAADGIEILDGIKVFKDSSDDKPMIVYDRAIKTSEVALGVGNRYGVNYSFHGLGLKQEASGSISPVEGSITIHGGYNGSRLYDDNTVDFTTYKNLLGEAGLYPSENLLPDHSKVNINAAGSAGNNIAENGMYDFILAYYNPASTGATSADDALKARLRPRLRRQPERRRRLPQHRRRRRGQHGPQGRRSDRRNPGRLRHPNRRAPLRLREQPHRPHGELHGFRPPRPRVQEHEHCRGWG